MTSCCLLLWQAGDASIWQTRQRLSDPWESGATYSHQYDGAVRAGKENTDYYTGVWLRWVLAELSVVVGSAHTYRCFRCHPIGWSLVARLKTPSLSCTCEGKFKKTLGSSSLAITNCHHVNCLLSVFTSFVSDCWQDFEFCYCSVRYRRGGFRSVHTWFVPVICLQSFFCRREFLHGKRGIQRWFEDFLSQDCC